MRVIEDQPGQGQWQIFLLTSNKNTQKKNKNNPTNIPEIVEKFAARERSDPSAGEVRANSKRNPPDGSFELFTHMYM